METKLEKIVRAALRDPADNDMIYHVPSPERHHHIFEQTAKLFGIPNRTIGWDQGFIAEKEVDGIGKVWRFVDRHEACKIAREAGQIKTKTGGEDELYSEDVW